MMDFKLSFLEDMNDFLAQALLNSVGLVFWILCKGITMSSNSMHALTSFTCLIAT